MIGRYYIQSVSQVPDIAAKIITAIPKGSVVLLYGDLGAGKTTLTSSIVKVLGATEQVSSPTFSIINTYETPSGELHHIDLYRLKDTEEALDIGIEDYLDPQLYTFVEWPQIIENILPLYYYEIRISVEEETREITLSSVQD